MCRQYQPIWDKLKSLTKKDAESIGVSIQAPRVLHPRIIKAVKKEKWKDLGYKLKLEPKTAELETFRKGEIITFFLKFSLVESDF